MSSLDSRESHPESIWDVFFTTTFGFLSFVFWRDPCIMLSLWCFNPFPEIHLNFHAITRITHHTYWHVHEPSSPSTLHSWTYFNDIHCSTRTPHQVFHCSSYHPCSQHNLYRIIEHFLLAWLTITEFLLISFLTPKRMKIFSNTLTSFHTR